MELDFETIRALSSPTRIEILNLLQTGTNTPTQISSTVGKSKSTVVSHLETLQKAGLVHKDKQEGRKRVEYSATDKASSIVKGKERKVTFSVATAFLLGGLTTAGYSVFERMFQAGGQMSAASQESGDMSSMAMDQAAESASSAGSEGLMQLLTGPEVLLVVSAGFLSISVGTFFFGLMLNRLTADDAEA